ncbi:MAG: nuclear transport factor 2 family protein [Burkholderiaceae bacterium]|nr:nuclear transport factor 2 family protein [Burkholderiaceae bacterium]
MEPSTPAQLQSTRSSVAQIITFFETLTPKSLSRVKELYTPDATFKDPFNEVRGLAAIEPIYSHMFEALNAPRFIITSQIVDGSACFLIWEFKFYFKNFDKTTEQTVRGGTHLILDAQGKITAHRDYWDAAEEVYEKLPVVGGVMRWLKRQANS